MNQRVGYARVSTRHQDRDVQRDLLTRAGCNLIYEDSAVGEMATSSPFEWCREALRAGDTLVVWRLDQLGRSLSDILRIVVELKQRNISFESLTEKIETETVAGKQVLNVFATLLECERNIIRERAQIGLTAARARGRAGGRKPKLDDQQVREIKALLSNPDVHVADVARRYGVSRTTLYKHVGVVTPRQ